MHAPKMLREEVVNFLLGLHCTSHAHDWPDIIRTTVMSSTGWGGAFFSSLSSVAEKARESVAPTFEQIANDVKLKAQEAHDNFMKEHEKFTAETGKVKPLEWRLPWETDDEAKTILSEDVRDLVMALNLDKTPFLGEIPDAETYPFEFEPMMEVARRLILSDKKLEQLHFELPRRVSERGFWTIYFHACARIRVDVGMDSEMIYGVVIQPKHERSPEQQQQQQQREEDEKTSEQQQQQQAVEGGTRSSSSSSSSSTVMTAASLTSSAAAAASASAAASAAAAFAAAAAVVNPAKEPAAATAAAAAAEPATTESEPAAAAAAAAAAAHVASEETTNTAAAAAAAADTDTDADTDAAAGAADTTTASPTPAVAAGSEEGEDNFDFLDDMEEELAGLSLEGGGEDDEEGLLGDADDDELEAEISRELGELDG